MNSPEKLRKLAFTKEVPPRSTSSNFSELFYHHTTPVREPQPNKQLLSEDFYGICRGLSSTFVSRRIINFRGTPIMVNVTGVGSVPGWLSSVAEAIERVASLPENWNSYTALPVQLPTAIRGLQLLGRTMPNNAAPPSVHPTADGGIQFEWTTPEMDVEVEVTPDGRTLALVEDLHTGEEWEDDVTQTPERLYEVLASM
jgi:hypothetical protein